MKAGPIWQAANAASPTAPGRSAKPLYDASASRPTVSNTTATVVSVRLQASLAANTVPARCRHRSSFRAWASWSTSHTRDATMAANRVMTMELMSGAM